MNSGFEEIMSLRGRRMPEDGEVTIDVRHAAATSRAPSS